MMSSQNGWPASPKHAEIDIVTVAVPLASDATIRGGRSLKINATRRAAPALVTFAQFWDQEVEPITEIGSWNYREIRGKEGTGNLSNHASGTALDINPKKHKLGAVGTVPADKRAAISAKAAELGLRWGGDYRHRRDEMHVEIASGIDQFLARVKAGATVAAGVVAGGVASAVAWLAPHAPHSIDPAVLLWRLWGKA